MDRQLTNPTGHRERSAGDGVQILSARAVALRRRADEIHAAHIDRAISSAVHAELDAIDADLEDTAAAIAKVRAKTLASVRMKAAALAAYAVRGTEMWSDDLMRSLIADIAELKA
ncbi:MAG: hypothetical protein ABL908_17705 [Hyphomicrobium sp.]